MSLALYVACCVVFLVHAPFAVTSLSLVRIHDRQQQQHVLSAQHATHDTPAIISANNAILASLTSRARARALLETAGTAQHEIQTHAIDFGAFTPDNMVKEPCIYVYVCAGKRVYIGKAQECRTRTQQHVRAYRTWTGNTDIVKGLKRLKGLTGGAASIGDHDACTVQMCSNAKVHLWVGYIDPKTAGANQLRETEAWYITHHPTECNRQKPKAPDSIPPMMNEGTVGIVAFDESKVDP